MKYFLLFTTILFVFILTNPVYTQTTTPATSTPQPAVSELGIEVGDLFGLQAIQNNINLGSNDPRLIATSLINLLLGFLGIITVIMILWSGVLWLFSFGNEERTTRAKRTLLNTIIGLIIILSANSIVVFVLNSLTNGTAPNL